jgi:Ca2+-binding RTX toxin-like protein
MTTRNFRGINYEVKVATTNSQLLTGTPQSDWIEILGGNNTVSTGNGNDIVLAGVKFLSTGSYNPFGGEAIFWSSRTDAGNNIINTGEGDDYVAAGIGGNDIINLGAGNDIFDGAVGNVLGGTGNDIINAGAGNDIVYAWGVGNKIIDGGTGNDVISVRGSGNVSIIGGDGNDRVSVVDFARGVIDQHIIFSGTGDDSISAESSDDIFIVDAGSGNDFIDIATKKGAFDAGDGNDDIYALFASDNKILGGRGNDLIILDSNESRNNIALGGIGDDTIVTIPIFGFDPSSLLGNHEIHGGEGNDMLFSGMGNDIIYDEGGNDIINLRGGSVNLRGNLTDDFHFGTNKIEVQGGGADTVYLGAGKDIVLLGREGTAIIYGFAATDQLDLGGLNVNLSRNQQGNTLITTSNNIQLATLIGYTGQVNII